MLRDNQPTNLLLATIIAAIITSAATPDSHPDCRAPLIQIVALYDLNLLLSSRTPEPFR